LPLLIDKAIAEIESAIAIKGNKKLRACNKAFDIKNALKRACHLLT
jgi:hypothetical protein